MDTALTNFRSSAARVRSIANDASANSSAALASRDVMERLDTTLCAATVILSGFFESFLKELAEAYAADISSRQLTFASLPPEIQRTHYEQGGKILSLRAKQERSSTTTWITDQSTGIATRLASVTGAPPYELLWEAFADTRGNPSSEVLRDFLSKFSVQDPMAKLAAETGYSKTIIQTTLNSFIAVRNECAHSGRAVTNPTASDVIGYCDFLERLAEGLVKVLTAHTF